MRHGPTKRTEAELRAILARPEIKYRTARGRRHKNHASIDAKKELATGEIPKVHGKGADYFYSFIFTTVLILNEAYILADGRLPTNENPYAVGQWGPWVRVALTLVAAAILRHKIPAFLERQKVLDAERAAFELRHLPKTSPTEAYVNEHGVPAQDGAHGRSETGHDTNSLAGTTTALGVGSHEVDRKGALQHGLFTLRNRPTL